MPIGGGYTLILTLIIQHTKMKIHKFISKEEGQKAVSLINKGEGYPIGKDSVTKTYCELQEFEGWYYIIADAITRKYLKACIEFDFPIQKNIY